MKKFISSLQGKNLNRKRKLAILGRLVVALRLDPSEVSKYKDNHLRRLSMKPGITGLWQVSGRNKIKDFDQWVKLDLEYIENWSFLMDFRIAVKTVSTVFSGNGM